MTAEPTRTAHWDLVIVGAGPAGSATALGALSVDPHLRVLLLDRDAFPRDKTCGDGVTPHVLDALAEVGVHGLLDDWTPVPQLRLDLGADSVRRPLARQTWVVPRAVLDARLVAAATAAGAELAQHRVRAVRPHADRVVVDEDLGATVLVGADGAQSLVRRASGLTPVRRRALALRGYAPTPVARAGQQVIAYGRGHQPAYAWSFDRGDGYANVGYGELLRGSTPPSRALLLQRLDELLPGATDGVAEVKGHLLPLSSWRWPHPQGRVLLVGDAAGLVNPMTGEGIYHAVTSGIVAGRTAATAIGEGLGAMAGGRYRVALHSRLGSHQRHTAAVARLSSHSALVRAGIRAAAADQAVFDDLVEVGLAFGRVSPRTVARVLAPRRSR